MPRKPPNKATREAVSKTFKKKRVRKPRPGTISEQQTGMTPDELTEVQRQLRADMLSRLRS